jgi:hypothetical protein
VLLSETMGYPYRNAEKEKRKGPLLPVARRKAGKPPFVVSSDRLEQPYDKRWQTATSYRKSKGLGHASNDRIGRAVKKNFKLSNSQDKFLGFTKSRKRMVIPNLKAAILNESRSTEKNNVARIKLPSLPN